MGNVLSKQSYNMKTFADLKRDLKLGTGIEMVNFHNGQDIPERLQSIRYVVKVKSNGVELNKDKNATKGSLLEYTKATLTEYDGENLRIYDSGTRELTEWEKSIRDNVPSRRAENKDAVHNELMTDGNGFYWKDKAYYKENNAEYLAGHETVRGLRYDFNTKQIIDDTIKGELSLAYKIIKEN